MIAIRAEVGANPEVCRFIVEDHVIYAGGSFLCASPAAAPGEPLLESLFALEGISQALISGDCVTLQKSAAQSWQILGKQVGAVLRAHIESGARFVAPEGRGTAGAPGRGAGAGTARLPGAGASATESLAARVRGVLDTQVNPGVAGHGGKIELVEIQDGSRAVLKMSGGCQGCGSAKATLKLGVEKVLRAQVPEITEVVDVTDHSAGQNPYFAR